jgi:hypothetical protein
VKHTPAEYRVHALVRVEVLPLVRGLEAHERPSSRAASIRRIRQIERAAFLSMTAGLSGDWSRVRAEAARLIPPDDIGLDEDLMYRIELAAWPVVGRQLLLPETWQELAAWTARHAEPAPSSEEEAMWARLMQVVGGTLSPFDIAGDQTSEEQSLTPALGALSLYLRTHRAEDARAVLRRCAPFVEKQASASLPPEATRLLENLGRAADAVLPIGHRRVLGVLVGKMVRLISGVPVEEAPHPRSWWVDARTSGMPYYFPAFPRLLGPLRDAEPTANGPLFVPDAEELARETGEELTRREEASVLGDKEFIQERSRRSEATRERRVTRDAAEREGSW